VNRSAYIQVRAASALTSFRVSLYDNGVFRPQPGNLYAGQYHCDRDLEKLSKEPDLKRSSPKWSGSALIGLGVASACIALLVWIPPELEQARSGEERDLGVGIIAATFSIPISFVLSIVSLTMLTNGTLRLTNLLPRLPSPWWALVWAGLAWLPIGCVNFVEWLFFQLDTRHLLSMLESPAIVWVFASSSSAVFLLLGWIVKQIMGFVTNKVN
jgi:hypothetical protein